MTASKTVDLGVTRFPHESNAKTVLLIKTKQNINPQLVTVCATKRSKQYQYYAFDQTGGR